MIQLFPVSLEHTAGACASGRRSVVLLQPTTPGLRLIEIQDLTSIPSAIVMLRTDLTRHASAPCCVDIFLSFPWRLVAFNLHANHSLFDHTSLFSESHGAHGQPAI
jgi:hypothetical protein